MFELHGLSWVSLEPFYWTRGTNRSSPESRKLEVRCGLKTKDQTRKVYVHMLNGTLCATERALCCLVENHQTPDVSPSAITTPVGANGRELRRVSSFRRF